MKISLPHWAVAARVFVSQRDSPSAFGPAPFPPRSSYPPREPGGRASPLLETQAHGPITGRHPPGQTDQNVSLKVILRHWAKAVLSYQVQTKRDGAALEREAAIFSAM